MRGYVLSYVLSEQVEWAAWLHQYQSQLPQTDNGFTANEQVAKIAAETGRNMLFLSPFIRPTSVAPATWTFAAAWAAFLGVKEVSKIYRNLKDFVGRMEPDRYPSRRDALGFIASAICTGSVQVDMPNFYDARYFCVLDGIAHTVGQYVSRCAASVIESQCRLDIFRDSLWINTIRLQRSNPSVLGFLVEKAVLGYLGLSAVLARVLQRPDLSHQRVEIRSFKLGTEASALGSSSVLTLYIPEEFNYRAVDAVVRIVERRTVKTAAQPTRVSKRVSKQKSKPSKKAKVEEATAAAVSSSSTATVKVQHDVDERVGVSADDDVDDDQDDDDGLVPTTTITLVPIQITTTGSISQFKRDKSFRFFERRSAWLSDFRDDPRAAIHLRFAFIVRQCAMQVEEPAVPIDREAAESFRLTFVSLASVDEQLDRAVDSPAASTSAQQRSPPKLMLGSTGGR